MQLPPLSGINLPAATLLLALLASLNLPESSLGSTLENSENKLVPEKSATPGSESNNLLGDFHHQIEAKTTGVGGNSSSSSGSEGRLSGGTRAEGENSENLPQKVKIREGNEEEEEVEDASMGKNAIDDEEGGEDEPLLFAESR